MGTEIFEIRIPVRHVKIRVRGVWLAPGIFLESMKRRLIEERLLVCMGKNFTFFFTSSSSLVFGSDLGSLLNHNKK
jgi:hypothetical protein